jgi:hypothetical protein
MTTPYIILASDPGDYTITAVEDAHCQGPSYGMAIVRKYPIPAKPEITIYFTELISSSCCGNQWYLNGAEIPGATGQTYQVYISGLYNVMVTLNGCSSDLSDTVDMIVGVPEYNTNTFRVFPNPAKDLVNIQQTRLVKGNVILSLYSTIGIMVREFEFTDPGQNFSIDIGDLPEGMYFLKFSSVEGTAAAKLIVK